MTLESYLPTTEWRRVGTGLVDAKVRVMGAVRLYIGSTPSDSESTLYAFHSNRKREKRSIVVSGDLWIRSRDTENGHPRRTRSVLWVDEMSSGVLEPTDTLDYASLFASATTPASYLSRAQLIDLPNTAGRTSTGTLQVPGSDALPAGVTLAGNTVTVSGDDVTLSDWDLNGFKVVQSGNNLTISQCLTGGNQGGYWMEQSSGVSGLSILRSSITPYTRVGSNAWIEITADNTVIEDCLLFGHPTDIIKSRGQNGCVIRRCALGRPNNYSLAVVHDLVTTYDTGEVVTDGSGGYWYSNVDGNTANALPSAGSSDANWEAYSGSGAPHFDQINPSGAAGDLLIEGCYFDTDRDASADTHTNNVLRIGGGASVTVGSITFRNNYIHKGSSIGPGRPFELSGTLTVETDAVLSWQDNYLSYGNNDSMVSGIGPDDFYGKAFWSGNVDVNNSDAVIGIPSSAWFAGVPGDVVPAIPVPSVFEVVSTIAGPTTPATATQLTLEMSARIEHIQGQADIFNNQGGTAQRIEVRGGSDNGKFSSTFRSNENGVVITGGSAEQAVFRDIWTVMRFEVDLEAGTYRIYQNDSVVHETATSVDTSSDTLVSQTWEFYSEAARLIDGSNETLIGPISMWWGSGGSGVGVSGAVPTRTPDWSYTPTVGVTTGPFGPETEIVDANTSVSMPAHVSGDNLVLALSGSGESTDNPPDLSGSGWTQIATAETGTSSSAAGLTLYSKTAASDTETLTIAYDPRAWLAHVYNAGSASVTVVTNSESSTAAGSTSHSLPVGDLVDGRLYLQLIAVNTQQVESGDGNEVEVSTLANTSLDSFTEELDINNEVGARDRGLIAVSGTANLTGTGAATTFTSTLNATTQAFTLELT